MGLAAWILEKYHTCSDHRGDLNGYLGRDEMLTNIMLYWVTGAILLLMKPIAVKFSKITQINRKIGSLFA